MEVTGFIIAPDSVATAVVVIVFVVERVFRFGSTSAPPDAVVDSVSVLLEALSMIVLVVVVELFIVRVMLGSSIEEELLDNADMIIEDSIDMEARKASVIVNTLV